MTAREEFEKYADQFAFYGEATKQEDWETWQIAWQASRAAALEAAAKEVEKTWGIAGIAYRIRQMKSGEN